MRTIVILGSTGSIGIQVLDVVREQRANFRVAGLATYSNVRAIKSQILEFSPHIVSVWDNAVARKLREWCASRRIRTEVVSGIDGLVEIAQTKAADLVISSVVGAIGTLPLLAALRNKKPVALANKEALVIAGEIVMAEARKNNVPVIPVDSEHSAVFQCIKNEDKEKIRKIILTASGGPFYRSRRKTSNISVREALAHPTWNMGPKITIDSATLMNKGLEVIEAHHLFGLPYDRIDIVIHPQSIVHSMVEFVDGAVLAQLSPPDMRLPIQHALTYPERTPSALKRLDLARVGSLEFSNPDFRRFPCLGLALSAGTTGGTMPAAMNAANEVAVEHFLKGRLSFGMIPKVIEKVMARHRVKKTPGLEEIIETDVESRHCAHEIAARCS